MVEDDDLFFGRFAEEVGSALGADVALRRAASGSQAREAAASLAPDLVLCDLSLPPGPGEVPDDDEGERVLEWLERLPEAPRMVVLSGQDLGRAVHLVTRRKVQDFVSKAASWEEIRTRVRAAVDAVLGARAAAPAEAGEERLVGEGPAMAQVRETLRRASASDATVLLLGETGTGKSLAARWLHECSPRAAGPFVAVACGALPRDLVEAELFGHSAGAFTGAKEARRGRFRSADGGTLFLDELGEIPLATQAKLLRVLEEREVEPLGSDRSVPVDVRLVGATHRDLAAMVAEGSFREDLFYRLRVLTVTMPPLRERMEDLEGLIAHFLTELKPRPQGLTADAWAYLRARPWKGNVRELRATLEAAAVHAVGDRIHAVALHAGLGPWGDGGGAPVVAGPDPFARLGAPDFQLKDWLAEQEEALIQEALRRSGGNAADAARLLGEKPDTLRARLRRSRKP